jgi:hypothetical protein
MNQDVRNGKGTLIVSGGEGFLFVPSIVVQVSKLKLKAKSGLITGMRMTCEVIKSRFNQLGGKIQLEVPYDEGLDPFEGLCEMCEDAGLLTRSGSWYSFVKDDGEVLKFQKKNFEEHVTTILPDFHDENEELDEIDEPIET